MITPCKLDNPCKLCKIATNKDKERWEEKARWSNQSYFKLAKSYYAECFDNLKQLSLSQANEKTLEYVQVKIEESYKNVETQIDATAVQAKNLVWWKDIYYLYEKIDKQHEYSKFRMRPIYHKHLIFEEWQKIFKSSEFLVCQMAEHVEDCKAFYGLYGKHYFGILNKPKVEPCEEDKCKKCLETKTNAVAIGGSGGLLIPYIA